MLWITKYSDIIDSNNGIPILRPQKIAGYRGVKEMSFLIKFKVAIGGSENSSNSATIRTEREEEAYVYESAYTDTFTS